MKTIGTKMRLCCFHTGHPKQAIGSYDLAGGAPEAYSSHCICLSVHVCVFLQHTFLCNCNELSSEIFNATTIQYSNTAKLVDVHFKALLSSYSMMCSPWWPFLAIESPVKSELPTTNHTSPWRLHLYCKIDSEPSEISRTGASKFCSLGQGMLFTSLMMMC